MRTMAVVVLSTVFALTTPACEESGSESCSSICDWRACGEFDSCTCGYCPSGYQCVNYQCEKEKDGPECGDGMCEGVEDCTSCAADCGECEEMCGNATCGSGETCATCPADCGPCENTCGDGGCAGGESCQTCPVDCGDCPCAPNCAGRECGSDECEGSCGDCPADEHCSNGKCQPDCVPNCGGKECGGDGCDGSCGQCTGDLHCVDGACESDCTPNCAGKECGDDGCGGECGPCPAGYICDEDQYQPFKTEEYPKCQIKGIYFAPCYHDSDCNPPLKCRYAALNPDSGYYNPSKCELKCSNDMNCSNYCGWGSEPFDIGVAGCVPPYSTCNVAACGDPGKPCTGSWSNCTCNSNHMCEL